MKSRTIITLTFSPLLLLLVAGCQQQENQNDRPAADNPNSQAPEVVELGHGYVRKDGAIHFIGGGTTGIGENATRIDYPSPAVLKGFMDSKIGPFKTAEGVDVESFVPLAEEYSRDQNHVYYKIISPGVFLVIRLPEADPETFDVIATNLARDRNHVWLYERIQPEVDPSTVELVDTEFSVFKDKDSVHYQHTRIAGADPASFKHLDSGYYADRNKVYWGPEAIPNANPVTFEVLGESFIAKDGSSVYRSGQALPGYDVESLELILHNPAGFQIFSDKSGIHVNKMTFPRSKPGKAEVIDDRTVKVGDLALLVEPSRNLPVTVFKEDGKLMAETPAYDHTSGKVQGTVHAEVTEAGLKDIRISPLPGDKEVPSVPDWRMQVFNNDFSVQQMLKAGKHIN